MLSSDSALSRRAVAPNWFSSLGIRPIFKHSCLMKGEVKQWIDLAGSYDRICSKCSNMIGCRLKYSSTNRFQTASYLPKNLHRRKWFMCNMIFMTGFICMQVPLICRILRYLAMISLYCNYQSCMHMHLRMRTSRTTVNSLRS